MDAEPERVLDLLGPLVESMTSEEDIVRAYFALEQAEFLLQRFQRAAVYAAKVAELRPSPENLYSLAFALDLGGDLEGALEIYERLGSWIGPEGDPFREIAHTRIRELSEVLLTPTPYP